MELNDALAQLSADCRDFWAPNNGRVASLATPPPSATFQREYVQKSKPVVVAGAFSEWRCMKKWSLEYLAAQNGDAVVTVNATPDGRADSVKWCQLSDDPANEKRRADNCNSDENSTDVSDPVRLFVLPEERQMTMRDFKSALTDHDSPQAKALGANGIPYLSRQNDSLRAEFSAVADDVPSSGPAFAVGAFGDTSTAGGADPNSGFEAVNLWVGDGRSVTSAHQDPYENLYCVLRGTKRFTLLPPCDAPFVNEQPFRQGQHRFKRQRASRVPRSESSCSSSVSTGGSCSSKQQSPAEDSSSMSMGKDAEEEGAGEWVVDVLEGALNWVDALDEEGTCMRASPRISDSRGVGTVGSGSDSRCSKHGSGSDRKTSALVDALAATQLGQRATPVVVQVHAGECLYLPAMWYHRVEQVMDCWNTYNLRS